MTYFNKIKETTVEMPAIGVGQMDGYFEFETYKGVEFPKGSGNVFEFAGTRKKHNVHANLVTDYGLESFGEGVTSAGAGSRYYHARFLHVGTGNTPPSNGDTSLGSWVASQINDDYLGTTGCTTVAPIYGWARFKARFNPGFAGGNVNINEAGASHGDGNTVSMNSKALTVDDQGNPATVPVLADEYLDVYYTRRNYPGYIVEETGLPNDGTGTVDVSGTTYGYTIRAARVGDAQWGAGGCLGFNTSNGYSWNIFSAAGAFDSTATLGPLTSVPNGTSSTSESAHIDDEYVANSKEEFIRYYWGLDKGNVTGGIGGLLLKSSIGCYQMVFDAPIPKDNTKIFNFIQRFSWDRKTIT